MKLLDLLKLQALYCILGILFNALSWIFILNGKSALTPTLPLGGMIVLVIYGIFLVSGYFKKIKIYRLLMLLSLIIFGYGGIVKHILGLSQTPELYYSIFSGILGILINLFGFILNLLAVLRKFTFEK